MHSRRLLTLACLTIAALAPRVFAHPEADEPASRPVARLNTSGDTCLLVSAENIVKGNGNWYCYVEFKTDTLKSQSEYTFEKGDRFEYDIFMPATNPSLKGGIDLDVAASGKRPDKLAANPWLRDFGLKDQKGILFHGDGILTPAKDQWYHRTFNLDGVAGAKIERFSFAFEGDEPGRYVEFLDNIRVTRDGRTVLAVWENGRAPQITLRGESGYSQTVLLATVPHEKTYSAKRVNELLDHARALNRMRRERDEFHSELEIAGSLAKRLGDEKLAREIEAAKLSEDKAAYAADDAERYLASLHDARHRLGHAHPLMQKFTGHLVGHAHIDLQWLWTWDEVVDKVIPDTFGQAIKFMNEFKDFTFSQSSACLYLATEQHHPKLFEDIKQRVKEGRWELVGGRWCEGDENMISPESHARHFLYGQRYFQSRFGRMATVGWEPDTFGHTWQMPQLLKLAGIDSFYFCRGGKKQPLFWWEAPDGSKVLAFDEPATGGWYNDTVDDDKVRELARFVGQVNSFDHLMVYGVGNHGGGPTREYIESALAMQKRGLLPNIKFSTASQFFAKLHEQAAPLSIPTIRDELNPVFEGCYTTHSRIKKYNRDSETALESTEVYATIANTLGRQYPREAFEDMWRDVTWAHHHDTLPGSFIHASALYSYRMYDALLGRVGDIRRRSEDEIVSHIQFSDAQSKIVVFNPLAWTRSEVVETNVITMANAKESVAIKDGSIAIPSQLIERRFDGDVEFRRIVFCASSVPGCGFKVYSVASSPETDDVKIGDIPREPPLPKFPDADSLHLQVIKENPHGMSAWTLGAFDTPEVLDKPLESSEVEDGPVRKVHRTYYRYDKSRIIVDRVEIPGRAHIEYDLTVDWGQIGNDKDGGPMLKAAFSTGVKADTATFEVPFADIARKTDGHEDVALKWCDLTGFDEKDHNGGVAILNDCKHAYDVKDGIIRLTLVRSSFSPDPAPDLGTHYIRIGVLPHDGPLDKADISRAAWEFNKPLQAVFVPAHTGETAKHPSNALAEAWSLCRAEPANIIVTAVKCAEEDDDLVIRAYECAGRPTDATLTLGVGFTQGWESNLLEQKLKEMHAADKVSKAISAPFKPYEIKTFRLKRAG